MFPTMRDKWIGLLHHVCNDHDWPGESCDHVELPEDHSLPWFDRRAKDFKALQKIILDPALLESLMSYIKFRKTVYKARKKLTAIDWNYHNDLPNATNEDADTVITRKYNQRTKSWDVKTVKVSKDYGYIWILIAKIFKLRVDDDDSVT